MKPTESPEQYAERQLRILVHDLAHKYGVRIAGISMEQISGAVFIGDERLRVVEIKR